MILGRGMKLSATGLLAGGALAAGLGMLLRTLLFGVTPAAPGVFLGTAAALLLVAVIACVIPAQRAARGPCSSTAKRIKSKNPVSTGRSQMAG
jgi:hypothetical protein